MSEVKKQYRLKNLVLFSSLLAAGALLKIASEVMLANPLKHWVSTAGDIVLTGCVLSLLFEIYLRSDILKMMHENHEITMNEITKLTRSMESAKDILKACGTIGLEKIYRSDRDYDFPRLVETAKTLTIVMDDGLSWFTYFNKEFQRRLQHEGRATHVYLVHPESRYVEFLSHGTNGDLARNVRRTVEMLGGFLGPNHQLEVHGHLLASSYCLVLSDDEACQVPSFIGAKTERAPLFSFAKTGSDGMYASIESDLAIIKRHSRMLFPYEAPMREDEPPLEDNAFSGGLVASSSVGVVGSSSMGGVNSSSGSLADSRPAGGGEDERRTGGSG